MYLWQAPGWPCLTWDANAATQPLAQARPAPGQGDALRSGCDGLTESTYRRAFPSIQSAATSALANASAALATMIHR